ncbi:hypothetical protein JDV02_003509 [Purpureocillium takamizusanense]|uniref:Uncharacterized protein n=1 Tax=Purpureocillium takamizusanense TaxID=2060973 RepID=A0A9Q8V8X4_9HYPO|nr:uncharacterized protein JDV02_003509 [Purpureocillium takamizusanense]UNI17133.1 hypothetical protein JDV02_003509 [Purpureocillium takamizusanense]
MCYFELQLLFCPCDKGVACVMKHMGTKVVRGRIVHMVGRTWCPQEQAFLPRTVAKPCQEVMAKGAVLGQRECPKSPPDGEFDVTTNYVAETKCKDCTVRCIELRKSERLAARNARKTSGGAAGAEPKTAGKA